MELVVRGSKKNQLQIFKEYASPLVITDTFLLMTLIPAAQCFLKFIGRYLMKSASSAVSPENQSTSSRELVEIFRNSAIKPDSQNHRDWENLLGSNMIRGSSLQNFSVSHFNFFPLSTSPGPMEETESSAKDLRKKSQESDTQIKALEKNVSRLNKILEQKEAKLTDIDGKMQNYHKYYCWSLVQIANLMKEENTLRDENINLLLLMEECCSDNEYYENKLKEYQEKLNQIEKEMAELTSDLEKRNEKLTEEKHKTLDQISQLTNENGSLKVENEVYESEVRKLEQMIELYKKRLEQIKQLVDTKNTEISNLEKTVTQLETKLIEVQKDKASTLREVQGLKTKQDDLTSTVKTLTDKNLILECSLHDSKVEVTNLSQTIKALEDDNEKLTLSRNIVEDEINTMKISYEQKLREKDALAEESQRLCSRKERELNEQLEHEVQEHQSSKKEINAAYTELTMMKTELKCRNELSKVMEEEHHKLNLSYEALYKEFSSTTENLRKTKEELNELKRNFTKSSEDNKHLGKIEESFKIREMKLEHEVREKLKSFESEVSNKTAKINQLERQNREHKTQIEKLRRELQVKQDEIVELKEKMAALQTERTLTKDFYNQKKRQHSPCEAQEILSLLEINSAHCKRYCALEKAYRDLSVEYAAYQHTMGMSARSSSTDMSAECASHRKQIRKLTEENGYLNNTLADYKRINSLLLDQIKVSVSQSVLEDSLAAQNVSRYDTPEKDTCSTLSVDDRNTADLWWENEVAIHPTTLYDSTTSHTLTYNPPCTETKSL